MAYKPVKKKNNAVILLLGLAVALGAMFSLRRCASGNDSGSEPKPSGGDTIDVAIEYSPLSLYRYDDTLGGFNYDLLRMIALRHGLTLKFHPVVSLSQSLGYVDSKVYDILAANLPATADFKDRYRFSEPVALDRQVLVQLKDSITGEVKVKTQLDLAGDTLWVVEGSSVKSRIVNLGSEIGDTIYMRYEPEYGPEQLFMMVALGEIDNAVVSENVAEEMGKNYPGVDISTDISFTQFQSWVVGDKRPELADSLDRWIRSFKESDDYLILLKRYKIPRSSLMSAMP